MRPYGSHSKHPLDLESSILFEAMTLQQMIEPVPHWYHEFEFAPGVIPPGARNSRARLNALDLPQNISGLRVLGNDIMRVWGAHRWHPGRCFFPGSSLASASSSCRKP
jgi:hypothetical protein